MQPPPLDIPPGGLVVDLRLVRIRDAERATSTRLDSWIDHVQRAAEPCIVLDVALRLRSASASALVMLQPPGAPLGLPVIPHLFDLVSPALEIGSPWHLPPVVAAQTGQQGRAIVRHRRADGAIINVDVIGVPLYDHGQVIGAAGFLSQVQ
jgi:hypothetical protein